MPPDSDNEDLNIRQNLRRRRSDSNSAAISMTLSSNCPTESVESCIESPTNTGPITLTGGLATTPDSAVMASTMARQPQRNRCRQHLRCPQIEISQGHAV